MNCERRHLNRGPLGRAFGKALREARKAARHKQQTLGPLAGISSTHLSLLERGRRVPSLAVVFAIASALDIKAERLVRQTRLIVAQQTPTAPTSASRAYNWSMNTKKLPGSASLDAAKAVMKRMLATPPAPHEAKGNDKGKTAGKRKRTAAR